MSDVQPHYALRDEFLSTWSRTRLSRKSQSSNYQELLMFFDQGDVGRYERTAILRETKWRWSRKQFNERTADKKQVNVFLSKTVITQFDVLAQVHDLKRVQIIEDQVRMETGTAGRDRKISQNEHHGLLSSSPATRYFNQISN